MRILVLCHIQFKGDRLASGLRTYGHEVTVAGANLGGGHFVRRFGRAMKLVFREANKSQLIILDGSQYDRTVALLVHKMKGIPLVLYLGGYFPTEYEEYANSSFRRVTRAIDWFIMTRLIQNCAHIVYKVEWLKDRFLNTPRLAILKDKPSSVIYGSPDPFFHPVSIKSFSQSNRELVLCHAGHFNYRDKVKGIVLLLDAYSQVLKSFPHLRFYICGDGRYRHFLQQRASQLNLDDKVMFTGKIGWGELREYYRRSDIFLYSSFLDGCPTTVLEAQACGLPAIVTYGSGAAELVIDGVSGIVCQPTVESLAESLSYLIQNPSIRHSMATQAVEHIQNDLSWKNGAAKFNEVIAGLSH